MNPRKGSRKRGYRGWKLRSEDKGWMTIRGKIWRLKAEAHVPSRRILVSEIPPMVLVGRAASEEGEAGRLMGVCWQAASRSLTPIAYGISSDCYLAK